MSSYLLERFANLLKSRLIFNIFYCFWMFVNKLFTYLARVHISKSKRCSNVKSSTYFHTNAKIFTGFQICISVPLRTAILKNICEWLLLFLTDFSEQLVFREAISTAYLTYLFWMFEMLVFIIRIIWILSNIWLMFICLKDLY